MRECDAATPAEVILGREADEVSCDLLYGFDELEMVRLDDLPSIAAEVGIVVCWAEE